MTMMSEDSDESEKLIFELDSEEEKAKYAPCKQKSSFTDQAGNGEKAIELPSLQYLCYLHEHQLSTPMLLEKTASFSTNEDEQDGINKKLRLIGVLDPNTVSACVKKAILKGFIHLVGPESMLELICYQKCIGKNCKKVVRVRVRMGLVGT